MCPTENEIIQEQIYEIVERAVAHGLEYELLTSSLKAMQENPEISILLAIQMGAEEWDI
jgi:hypothetical protein